MEVTEACRPANVVQYPRRHRRGRRAVLNHVNSSRGGIAGIYQRHDWAHEKRAALVAWAARLVSITNGRSAGSNVIGLTQHR